jgi:hypothetical protein
LWDERATLVPERSSLDDLGPVPLKEITPMKNLFGYRKEVALTVRLDPELAARVMARAKATRASAMLGQLFAESCE